jgi:DNA helicase II / ATP-dependent DNA helicase PcrA
VETDESLLSGLNLDQLSAVTHLHGPLKIVAGAGTGKTGTLTRRFAYLVEQGVAPDRILALTFSRRAASEYRERVLTLLDGSYPHLWIGTFHGFCLRVLRAERDRFGTFRVMGEPERRRMVARAVRDDPEAASRRYYVGESGAMRLVQDALTLLSRTKDEMISPVDFVEYADRRGIERLRELANVYLVYEQMCRDMHRLDFGDLASLLVEAFRDDLALLDRWRDRFEHVMVDEFQDTNEAQWRLLTLLAPPPKGNLTVVGDGAQAIYAFRGASSRFFNRFEDEYSAAKSIVLATNYRSRQRILDVAHSLIGCNTGHETHHLECSDGNPGEPVQIAGFVDEDAEADYVARSILRLVTTDGLAPSDCAVLCRSVKQSARPLVRAFTAYGVPFSVRGYDPGVEEALEDLSAVLRCVGGTATWTDAARVLVRRQVALQQRRDGLPEDALARRYAHLLGPNQELLQAVPPLDALTYGRVVDWLDGSEAWRPLREVREDLPGHLLAARAGLDRLEEACVFLRSLPLEGQVYAALALVGRLDTGSAASSDARAGISACRRALRAAHGLARAGLGIPELLGELGRLNEEDIELGERAAGSGVSVLTLHAAKGLEWPAVFIVGAVAGLLPAPLRLDRAFDLDDLAQGVHDGRRRVIAEVAAAYEAEPERERARRYTEEERRLAYVGCTRAKERLTVSYAHSYDRRETLPSPFIAELERTKPDAWRIDEESDAGVMLPLDVARAVRQQALAALGVSGRSVLPPTSTRDEDAGDVVSSVLSAQWTASRVAGGVPIRFRELPQPFVEESVLAVSFSGIDSYQACPRQFFYGHVLHIDARSGGASTTLGSKVHGALLALNRRWMERGLPPPDDEVQEVWRSTWQMDRMTIEAAMADPTTRVPWEPGFTFARQVVQAWQRGGAYLRRYYRWERELCDGGAQRVPVVLEHQFVFPYKDHVIDGRIDCVIRTPNGDLIVDYKSGKRSGDLKAAKSLQLAIYEQAWQAGGGASDGQVAAGYYFLAQEKDRSGGFEPWDSGKQVDTVRYDDGTRDELWGTIDAALSRITENDFVAAPAKGKDTCGRCAYSAWCEESLA